MTVRRAVVALFLLVVAAGTVRLLSTLAEPGLSTGGYVDFRDTIYAPGSAFLDGVDPYNSEEYLAHEPEVGTAFDLYAPHLLALALPLAVMPRAAAGVTWWLLNAVIILALAAFVVRRVRPAWGVAGVFGMAAVTLVSNPGRFNFLTGQATLPIVLGVYVAFTSASPWAAAAGTALALLKPQFGLPTLVLLAAAGRWRTAAAGAGLAALLAAPVVAALTIMEGSPAGLARAVSDNLQTSVSGADAVNEFRLDLVGSLMRVTGVRLGSLATLLVFLALAALGAALIRRWGQIDSVAMAVVGLVTVLSLFHLPYDELILVWPLTGLALSARRLGPWAWWAAAAMAAAAFNPLTIQAFHIGHGLDSVTTALLSVALAAAAYGIIRRKVPAGAGARSAAAPGPR